MTKRPHWLAEVVSMDFALMLRRQGLDVEEVKDIITLAVSEDLAGGVDVTSSATVPQRHRSVIELTARKPGIVAGAVVAGAVFDLVSNHQARTEICVPDGSPVQAGQVILRSEGLTTSLLTAERTALNILSHLSGVATATHEWVEALEGTGAQVRDTRKTTPGMRKLEKFAVRCGGGVNHRMSLSDAALVKDNHIVAAGGVVEAFTAVRKKFPEVDIEVEVDSLDQLRAVVEAGADLVLLDNFTPDMVREAVVWTGDRAVLEASGGITLERARSYGETGVQYIAVGAITHSAPALDVGADLHDLPESE